MLSNKGLKIILSNPRLLCLLMSLVSHNNSELQCKEGISCCLHLVVTPGVAAFQVWVCSCPCTTAWKRQHFLIHTKPLTVVYLPICCFRILESVGRAHKHGAQSDHSCLFTSSGTSFTHSNRCKHLSILNSDVLRQLPIEVVLM